MDIFQCGLNYMGATRMQVRNVAVAAVNFVVTCFFVFLSHMSFVFLKTTIKSCCIFTKRENMLKYILLRVSKSSRLKINTTRASFSPFWSFFAAIRLFYLCYF